MAKKINAKKINVVENKVEVVEPVDTENITAQQAQRIIKLAFFHVQDWLHMYYDAREGQTFDLEEVRAEIEETFEKEWEMVETDTEEYCKE